MKHQMFARSHDLKNLRLNLNIKNALNLVKEKHVFTTQLMSKSMHNEMGFNTLVCHFFDINYDNPGISNLSEEAIITKVLIISARYVSVFEVPHLHNLLMFALWSSRNHLQ